MPIASGGQGRLAELLGIPLLTDDARFAGSAGHRAEIHRYPPPM